MAKKVNVELNMTPFIGLFALLVVMLLLTAVWNKVAMLSTDTASTTSSDSPPPMSEEKKVKLNVTILKNHIEMAEDEKGTNIPYVNQEVDRMRLATIVNQWKRKYPDRTDIVLNTENNSNVTYDKLIAVFDTLVGHGFPDVGVNTQ
ncbi:MAG: biopolymer transporter ExbD [Bdellovibrionales bacterium]|nr:biopolymer transporter ExbD [Bdellovibrionales bacterium]